MIAWAHYWAGTNANDTLREYIAFEFAAVEYIAFEEDEEEARSDPREGEEAVLPGGCGHDEGARPVGEGARSHRRYIH